MEPHPVPRLSAALVLLLMARSTAPATVPASPTESSSNSHTVLSMMSSKLHDQCLQMDTIACLGLRALHSVARTLDSSVVANLSDRRELQKEADVDRILVRNVLHYLNSSLRQAREGRQDENKTEDMEEEEEEEGYIQKKVAEFARGSLFSRKMLFPLLVGVVLKMGSLIPLVLGKMTFLGTMSFLASKLSLLIIILMNLKKWFSGGDNAGQGPHHSVGHEGAFFPHHHEPQGFHHPHQPHDIPDYQQAVPHSGLGLGMGVPGPPYHRKTYVIRGRQLGGENLWSPGDNATSSNDNEGNIDSSIHRRVGYVSSNRSTEEDNSWKPVIKDRNTAALNDSGGPSNVQETSEIITRVPELKTDDVWKSMESNERSKERYNNNSTVEVKDIFTQSPQLKESKARNPIQNQEVKSTSLNNGKSLPNFHASTAARNKNTIRSRKLNQDDFWKPIQGDANNTVGAATIDSNADRTAYILRSRQLEAKNASNNNRTPLSELTNSKIDRKLEYNRNDRQFSRNDYRKSESGIRNPTNIKNKTENISIHAGKTDTDKTHINNQPQMSLDIFINSNISNRNRETMNKNNNNEFYSNNRVSDIQKKSHYVPERKSINSNVYLNTETVYRGKKKEEYSETNIGNVEQIGNDEGAAVNLVPTPIDPSNITPNFEENVREEMLDGFKRGAPDYTHNEQENPRKESSFSPLGSWSVQPGTHDSVSDIHQYHGQNQEDVRSSARRLDEVEGEHMDQHELRRLSQA